MAALAGEILMSLKESGRFFDNETTHAFCARAGFTPDSTRTLGFDTPSEEGSTSGRLFSKDSVGHTGFTGVSLWIDIPRDLIVVSSHQSRLPGRSGFPHQRIQAATS